MNFSQLELIQAIQEKGSISAAAEAVGFTQSAASRALSTLEDELGVTLVSRGRHGGLLTEVGLRLLPAIYDILGRADYIRQEAAAHRGLATGKLRIGSIHTMAPKLLSQFVSTFRQRYPGIETVMLEGSESDIMLMLQQNVIDVGLIGHAGDSANSVPIALDELKIVVSAQHRLAKQTDLNVFDLEGEAFVMPKFGCGSIIRKLFDQAQLPLNISLELSDGHSVLTMVREGLGITMLPHMSLPESMTGLRALSFDPPRYRELRAVVNNLKTVSPATNAFLDIIRNYTQCTTENEDTNALVQNESIEAGSILEQLRA
jgi:molybdate transport repressor ModE-like protein